MNEKSHPSTTASILIVDDREENLLALENWLENPGLKIVRATSGNEALGLMLEEDFALVLLDVQMPGIDGFETAELMRLSEKTKNIPIIFVTAINKELQSVFKGYTAGAVDYLSKPLDPDILKAKVGVFLQLYLHKRSLVEMQAKLVEKNIILERQINEIKEKTEQLREKDLQLLEMDRITGIGTLAAGIAHEINNPLGFLKSTLGTLNKNMQKMRDALRYWDSKPATEPLMQGYLEHVAAISLHRVVNSMDEKFNRAGRGLMRITDIVDNLKHFSGIDMEPLTKIDINKNIAEVLKVVFNQEEKKIEIITQLQDELPLVECVPYEINQCLLQLLKNAIDSLENEGTIKITSEWHCENARIVIRIVDSGRGMSPEVLRQAFNPFFTTKPVGSGTGVGLSLTERIIKRYCGMVQLESSVGRGTTATIKLPVCLLK
jgi:signal transduction histidine kinase